MNLLVLLSCYLVTTGSGVLLFGEPTCPFVLLPGEPTCNVVLVPGESTEPVVLVVVLVV